MYWIIGCSFVFFLAGWMLGVIMVYSQAKAEAYKEALREILLLKGDAAHGTKQ